MIAVTTVAYLIISAMSFSLTSLNAPSQLIKDFMNETELERTGEPFSQSKIESLYGLLVAMIGIGAAVGSLTADSLGELIGRKYAIIISGVTGTVGSLLMALCKAGKSYEMLFVGRTINGLALGWGLSLAPAYILEMCLPHQKGPAALANVLTQSTFVVVTQVFGYEEFLGNSAFWTYLVGFPAVLHVLQLILFPFCPQNPRYLLLNKQDEAGAIKALQLIRGYEDVKDGIKQIQNEVNESNMEAKILLSKLISIFKLFVTPQLRRPLIIAIAMGLHQNWCGSSGVLFFSETLFKEVGVTGASSRYATSGTGGILFLGSIVAVFLGQRFGRKTLFIASTASAGILSAVFSLTTIFKESAESLKYVNIVVGLLIIVAYSIGPVCIFWIILGELFPHSARGAGFGVALLCVFVGFFAHCYALPAMIESMSAYTFLVFAGIDAGMVVFCVFFMPETKNKSFADISKTWTTGENNKGSEHAPANMLVTKSYSSLQGDNGTVVTKIVDEGIENDRKFKKNGTSKGSGTSL